MAINTQFPIAVHLMTALGCNSGDGTPSSLLATSVNTSPSFVRRVLAKLSKAGLVKTATGKAGACWIARDARKISLLDIYKAVDAPKAFSIHNYREQKTCRVSCKIKPALEKALAKTQKAMETSLDSISLVEIVNDINRSYNFIPTSHFISEATSRDNKKKDNL